jgi:hypothetical protein
MTAAVISAPSSFVQLDWAMKDGVITVTPKDQDRFCIKVHKAIEILQQASRAEEFTRQFNLLLRTLATWIKDRDDVDRAYLTHRDGALAFVVMRTSCVYDDAFEDALSEMDFQTANDADLNLIKMDAIGLPRASAEAVSSFLDQSFTLEYAGHGDRGGSHSAG